MTREELLKQASSYISNNVYPNPNKFTIWYFKNTKTHAWCGAFIDYVVKHDLNCDWLDSCYNFAYVPTIVKWAKEKNYWTTNYKKAKKGDLVIYNWSPNIKNNFSHVGIVDSVSSTSCVSVEGNTGNEYYNKNCVAKKSRNKKYIVGFVLLPYEEEVMKFKEGDYVYAKEDIKLYTTVEYKENEYTLKKDEKAWVRRVLNNNVALANPITHEYFKSAWTNQLDKLTKDEPVEDYKKLYKEEVAKNKILQDKVNKLQDKINKAIEMLNG